MLKNAEVKERLNNMIGEELTNINLALLHDKPKCLKKQIENKQAYVIYKIIKTEEGYWAKIYLTGNPTQFRVGLEERNGKFYIKGEIKNEKNFS